MQAVVLFTFFEDALVYWKFRCLAWVSMKVSHNRRFNEIQFHLLASNLSQNDNLINCGTVSIFIANALPSVTETTQNGHCLWCRKYKRGETISAWNSKWDILRKLNRFSNKSDD